MKKIIMLIIGACIYLALPAQNVSLGPSAGIQHSWITGYDNVKLKPGFSFGGTLTYSPAVHWGLGGDIRASFMEGVKTSYSVAGVQTDNKINATYLRVPLKATYFFGEYGQKVRPKIYAGPSFGFLLGGETKSSYSHNTNITNTKEYVQAFDWGIVAGAGFNYRLKPNTWFNFDLAYNNGLTDISKGMGYHANRNLSLNLGVTFPLGTVIS